MFDDEWFTAKIEKIDCKLCQECKGTGIFESGVCHCGIEMEGHTVYDNHMATEMIGPCPYCEVKESL